jgi:tRNA pseudouridine32 synthase/23S rRNA pseudouridine746 synthase
MKTSQNRNSRGLNPSRAPSPSRVTLTPCEKPYPSLLDFLDRRFPKIGKAVWAGRLEDGKITDENGDSVFADTDYRPGMTLYYYREVDRETRIPFEERVIFQNEHILVADKPHFLPVTPSGPYVNECLLYRLKESTGLDYLVPLHRLDRETTGLVILSVNKATSGSYGDLFDLRKITKTYEAIGTIPSDTSRMEWLVESRIEPGKHWLLMENVEGEPNARTRIRLLETVGDRGRFELEPLTGKTHQLRLHMILIGSGIINDRFYPVLLPEIKDRVEDPLQLLAKRVSFKDPITREGVSFESLHRLSL